MTTFLKSQQKKAQKAFFEDCQGVKYSGLNALPESRQEWLDQIIAQTIKDTTARVREVMGEELPLEDGWDDSWAHGNNLLHRKVTQELNSLEE